MEKIRAATEAITAAPVGSQEMTELHDLLRRDVHTLGELARQDPDCTDIRAPAGALTVITPLLKLSTLLGSKVGAAEDAAEVGAVVIAAVAPPPNFADIEKEVCCTIGFMASKHQQLVANSGAISGLVAVLKRQPPQMGVQPAPGGDSRRLVDGANTLAHEVARRAADAIMKLAQDNAEVKALIR